MVNYLSGHRRGKPYLASAEASMSKDWGDSTQTKRRHRVSNLSQAQGMRQVEDQVSPLWQELSPLLLSSRVTSRSSLLTSQHTYLNFYNPPPNGTSDPNSTATPQASAMPWNCHSSEITKEFQSSPIPFCLPLNLFFIFTKTSLGFLSFSTYFSLISSFTGI